MDWSLYPNFTRAELRCRSTNECEMRPELMDILQSVRTEYGKIINISSGYRSPNHPIEAMKVKPGEHALGLAVDIICHGAKAIDLTELFFQRGIRRIGVHQKGPPNSRYIHIGLADKYFAEYPTAIWTY